MRDVTIRRCPECQNIGGHANQLASELKTDPNVRVKIEDGNKGEFTAQVDGRRIDGKQGDSLRDPREMAAEIRGTRPTTPG